MRIYVGNRYKHIIMAPAKTGSTTIEQMLQCRWNWDNLFIGKPINDPSNLLQEYISEQVLVDFKVMVLVRNPFDWIISGFRHIQYQAKFNNFSALFPDNLTDHLIAIKNNSIESNFWKGHCYYQPAHFLRPEYQSVRLENFDNFLRYLDRYCDSDYDKQADYKINSNNKYPYPDISDFEKSLILELTRKAAITTNYNVEQSIEKYRKKYNRGELNEFLEPDV